VESKLSNLLLAFKQSKVRFTIYVDSTIVANTAKVPGSADGSSCHILVPALVIFPLCHHIERMFYLATA